MLHTTFNLLREHQACEEGYRNLAKSLGGVYKWGRDTPIPLIRVLDSNGLDDALWCLRATIEDSSQFSRLLSADFAESVLHLFEQKFPGDDRPRKAIEAARAFARGRLTSKKLEAARDAAEDAAWDAARDAAWAGGAAWAATWDAAEDAAWAAARDAAWAAAEDAARDAKTGEQAQMLRAALLSHQP